MNNTILVTGGAGYIGSHCCKLLASEGYTPVVFDNLSTGHYSAIRWGPFVRGDVRDQDKLERTIRKYAPSAVMHFAALSLVGESVREPSRYWDVNARGMAVLLRAMRKTGLDKLVFSSTAAIYGEPKVTPIAEQAAKQPVSPYGATKLAAERMVWDQTPRGLNWVCLRYLNAAGADPDGEIGEDHMPETHLIPLVLDAAIGRRPAISVFGNDYATPDGTAVRDYIHVRDLALAHLAALEHITNGGESEKLNLGTGVGVSVKQLIDEARRVTGSPILSVPAQRRAGDPPVLVADPARARSVLGWEARHSNLRTILTDAWNWHRRRFGAVAQVAASHG